MCMDRTTLVDFFEDVETTEKYDGYFCSIAEVIGTVVLGSLCGFKNVSQIHYWAENAHTREFLKEKFQIEHILCYYWMLVLLILVFNKTVKNRFIRLLFQQPAA